MPIFTQPIAPLSPRCAFTHTPLVHCTSHTPYVMVLDWVHRLVPEHVKRGAGLQKGTSWRLGHRAGAADWVAPSWRAAHGFEGPQQKPKWTEKARPTQPWEHRWKQVSTAGKDLQHGNLFHIIQNGQWKFSIFLLFSPFFKIPLWQYHIMVLVIHCYNSVLWNHWLLLPTHKNKV